MNFIILCVIALLVSSIGFYKYVYFISLGYGFSIAIMSMSLMIMFFNQLTPVILLACLCLMIYGLRLGGYLLIRELKSSSYRRTMKKEIKDDTSVTFVAKFFIWISCAFLYVCQISPVLYRLEHHCSTDIALIIGMIVMILGMLLEGLADMQKSKAKKINPHQFVSHGLYKIVRCPNYLGEIVFWSGVFISGISVLSGFEWLIALFGYICIVYIMFGGARRLEIRQNKNYGQDPRYQNYVKTTPILLPFIPLYSVEKYKWLVG